MQAQAFDVDDFQPCLADFSRDHRQMRQLAVGEHIALDEFASTPPNRPRMRAGEQQIQVAGARRIRPEP